MTWDEFRKQWYPEHVACFTGIPAWMSKLEQSNDGPASRDVMKGWYKALRDVDLDAAIAASHKMHAGEIEEPKGFDRHPAAIRKACGLSRSKIEAAKPRYDENGNRLYKCLTCFDDGLVFCWHPASVAQIAKKGFEPHKFYYTCVLPCTCKSGDAKMKGLSDCPRFDPRRAMPIGVGGTTSESEQKKLLNWLSTREPIKPENHEGAFDEFSTTQSTMGF